VAFISSRIPQDVSDSEIVIRMSHPEFRFSGLKVDSVIKLDEVATILKDLVIGELGDAGPAIRKVNTKLSGIFHIRVK